MTGWPPKNKAARGPLREELQWLIGDFKLSTFMLSPWRRRIYQINAEGA